MIKGKKMNKVEDLHNRIMNIRLPEEPLETLCNDSLSYKLGHKYVRHVAAEMAIRADQEIERLEKEILLKKEALRVVGSFIAESAENGRLELPYNNGLYVPILDYIKQAIGN